MSGRLLSPVEAISALAGVAAITITACSPITSRPPPDINAGDDSSTPTSCIEDAEWSAVPGTALYHAYECESKLGPLPDFSLADGIRIPITQDGFEVLADNGMAVDWCDFPAAFSPFNPCQTGFAVARYEGKCTDGSENPDVTFVLFGAHDDKYAVIGHNAATGATCFFNTQDSADVGEPSPRPGEAGYEDYWRPPAETNALGCMDCHMADPFMHSPWIDQVKNPNNPTEPIVPLIATADSPYYVVGADFRQPYTQSFPGNSCTECHRAQCTEQFENYRLDQLHMPAPFYDMNFELEYEVGEISVTDADREEIRSWCATLEYFIDLD